MRRLSLSLACGDYEIVRSLKDGTVEPDGIDLVVLTGDRTRILRAERREECDLAEYNIVGYLMDRQVDEDLVALPVYPHRRFRHGFAFVRADRGIESPADLVGKRVGIRGRAPAAVIWLRGILADHYGLGYDAVQWVDNFGVLGEPSTNRPAGEPTIADNNARIDEALLEGELDAMLSPSFPPAFVRGDPRIRRLFPDYRSEEISYFRQTGIFPIMHVVLVRRALVEQHRWVPSAMAFAFERAKAAAYERLRNPRTLPLAFLQSAWEEQRELLGPDPWRYGLGGANRENLATILRYTHEQGLVDTLPRIEDVFVPLGDDSFTGTPGY
ncbi:MAG: ABC transporter substrate-binding protein [Acidimicrobiales bacterium]